MAQAQFVPNYKTSSYALTSDTLYLDSLSIVPHTLALRYSNGDLVDSSAYIFYPFASMIIWRQRPTAGVEVAASYRVYPFAFGHRYYRKDWRAYKQSNSRAAVSPFVYSPTDVSADKLIDFGSIDYSGNFTRGVSFGSNQSAVLNSALNLQLQGMVTRDLEVTASITDNNIPIQPEGNTQNLQEFDKIFIQLRREPHTVIVGDFDLLNPSGYFLRYTRKAQGAGYTGSFPIKNAGTLKLHAAGGISKGKFARNTLTVAEGNQGPYKLTGTNGETYLVILANTEQVFINGQKMARGADHDYVIDYNLGTVTFTPKRIITADLRVVVEFNYSEKSYTRSMIDARAEWSSKKVNTFFNFYTEQDAKNQSVQQNLTDNQKRFLAAIGDSVDKAFYTGVDTAAYDANRVLYERHDTLYTLSNGAMAYDTFYVYSTNPTKARYTISFSYVGEGVGRYLPAQTTANGRTYLYSLPIDRDGVLYPTGSYAPVIKLVTPQSQQLYTAGLDYAINAQNKITAEAALSNKDINTFSALDKKNDLGAAARLGYSTDIVTKRDSGQVKQLLHLDVNYEFIQNNFRPVDRFRVVEFARDFNLLGNGNQYFNEHTGIVNASYAFAKTGSINYRFRIFLQDKIYQGYENYLSGLFTYKAAKVTFGASYLHTTATSSVTDLIRPKLDISYRIARAKGLQVGIGLDHEINIYRDRQTDTLRPAYSHIWQNYKAYIGTPDSLPNQYKLEYTLRTEAGAQARSFAQPSRITHTVSLSGQWVSHIHHTLIWNATYRRVNERDSIRAAQELRNYYLARLTYTFSALKGFLKSSTLYEVAAGREQKVQLIYLLSPTNTGDYVWLGTDSTQPKKLEDFVVKNYTTSSSYIRSFTLTPEFYAVNAAQFNEVLTLNPAALLHGVQSNFAKGLSLFSILTSVQLSRKIYANRNVTAGEFFNPFPSTGQDLNLVSITLNSRNALYFNRTSTKINGQLDVNYIRSRNLLTAGFENKLTRTLGATIRWNIYKQLFIQSIYTNGIKANQSEFYANQQYYLVYNETNNELSYLFDQKLRIAATYYLGHKQNSITTNGGQQATIHQLALDAKYNRLNKTTISAKVSYATIKYDNTGNLNQQAEYAMLDGLKNGNNFIWNITIEQRLSGAIQLIMAYDGRKTGINDPVHTGRAEIRAIF
jgi:hypothetical protein